MITVETYAYGFKTLHRAFEAIENDLANDMLSLCEKPRPQSYRAKSGKRRYKIVIDVDHGHFDPSTDLAMC